MPKLLTDAAIRRLRADPTKVREVRDAGAGGLYLAIQPSGFKSFVLRGRRPDGRQGKVTLGPLALVGGDDAEPVLGQPLSLRAARVLANRLLSEKARGVDIAEKKIALKRRRDSADSFADVCADFVADHCKPRNRGWRETARVLGLDYGDGDEPVLLKNGLAQRWAAKPIAEIDGDMLHAVVDEARRKAIPGLEARTAAASNARGRAMAKALGRLFSWATQHRLVSVNVAAGMYRPPQPADRDRVLTRDEIRALWAALDQIGPPFAGAIRLLLLTGQRREEVAQMRWAELDADLTVWSIPSQRTKNGRPHQVPLPQLAKNILAAVPRMEGCAFVFSTTGVTPISGFSKIKARVDELMRPTEEWRLHDLRRTFVTHACELGVLPHVVESCVNHVSGHKGGVAGTYNYAIYAAEKKAALELWSDHVKTMVGLT